MPDIYKYKYKYLDLNAVQHEFLANNNLRRKPFGNFGFNE